MTLSELKTQFQLLVPEFPYTSYVSSVVLWFNKAQEEIARENLIEGSKSVTTTASTQDYTITKLIDIKKDGILYDGDELDFTTRPFLKTLYDKWQNVDAGTPLRFLYEQDKVKLVPKPNAAKTLEVAGYYFPDILEDDNDKTFEIDGIQLTNIVDLDGLVLLYAVQMAKFSLGEYQTVDQALSYFFAQLQNKKNKVNHKESHEIDSRQLDTYLLRRKQQRVSNAS